MLWEIPPSSLLSFAPKNEFQNVCSVCTMLHISQLYDWVRNGVEMKAGELSGRSNEAEFQYASIRLE